MSIIDEKVNEFKKQLLKDMLLQCTENQQKNFEKYFGSIANLNINKIDGALALVERTITSNSTG